MRELEPRRDVAVVVELRDEDLVAGGERAADRPREREVERRHVRAEDRLVRRAAQERRAAVSRACATSASLRRLVAEGAAEVRVRLAEVAGDRVDDGVRALRPAGPVEERGRRPAARRNARGRRRRRGRPATAGHYPVAREHPDASAERLDRATGTGLGRAVARDRAERRPQHVRGRRVRAVVGAARVSTTTQGMALANAIHNRGLAVVWSGAAGAGRAVLGAARRTPA